jgi:hypothetical protein
MGYRPASLLSCARTISTAQTHFRISLLQRFRLDIRFHLLNLDIGSSGGYLNRRRLLLKSVSHTLHEIRSPRYLGLRL